MALCPGTAVRDTCAGVTSMEHAGARGSGPSDHRMHHSVRHPWRWLAVVVAVVAAAALCVLWITQWRDRGASENGAGSAPVALSERSVVSAAGVAPVQIGMTVPEAAAATGQVFSTVAPAAAGGDCAYVAADGGPAGLSFMVVGDRVVRADVDQGALATTAGARIGMSEAAVQALYGGQLVVQPAKYVEGGHYLIASTTLAGGTAAKIIFETDGSTVTSYRAGQEPEVSWVEKCS